VYADDAGLVRGRRRPVTARFDRDEFVEAGEVSGGLQVTISS